ncbi:MAG: carbohydrate-binding domain-containing protein, partial [Planctomycetota bacterium]
MPRNNAFLGRDPSQRRSPGRSSRRARFERLEPRQLLAVTPIQIRAAGATGEEQMELRIDGETVKAWTNVGGDYDNKGFLDFFYNHPTTVTADRVSVAFVNDGNTSSGADKNLRVGSILVAGEIFQTEAASTWSTGTFTAGAGCEPGFFSTEFLHCNGEFSYLAGGRTIDIRAAGSTGEERMELRIGGETVRTWDNVGGDAARRQFNVFSYTHPTVVSLEEVSVAFVNDGITSAGADRNLRVNRVTLGGVDYESEAATVLTTVNSPTATSCPTGFNETEYLFCNSAFVYSAPEATAIQVRAAGATGQERMALQIDGVTVREWGNVGGGYNTRQFLNFNYTHPTAVTADRIRVAFLNDGITSTGADKNLRVDRISVDGEIFETQAGDVFSTGTWDSVNGCAPGFKASEFLNCNGYFQFEATPQNPGTIGIGATQFLVAEIDGVATVTFVRTGGTDGVATVDFTTVPGTATPGQDFVSRSGTVTFADGQAQRSVNITILNDNQGEGSETFNLAIDRVTGAVAGQPRTTTITIFDDEQPSTGNGVGLQGDYYDGQSFGNLLLSRTDAT